MTPAIRARLLGAGLLIAMFAAGFMAGNAWTRMGARGVNVDVRMTTGIPPELRRLQLTVWQEDTLRRILQDGQRQTLQVLHEFEPRLRAMTDSVDAAIRAALTPEQRTALELSRKARMRDALERTVDTVRR